MVKFISWLIYTITEKNSNLGGIYMYNFIKKLLYLIIFIFLICNNSVISSEIQNFSSNINMFETDLDPLVDTIVTVEIKKIRSLEKRDHQQYL